MGSNIWARRSNFGESSESYVSRLFKMAQNENGSRRPDLESVNGRMKPKLFIELKSTGTSKGSIVDAQLHYGITSVRDYDEYFGTTREETNRSMFGNVRDTLPTDEEKRIAHYYAVIRRTDGLNTSQVQKPFRDLSLEFGDIALAPHLYVFASFAVQRALKTNEPIRKVIENLRRVIEAGILDTNEVIPGFETARQRVSYGRINPHSWMDLHETDIRAIWQQDFSRLGLRARKRIEMIYEAYPVLRDLVRVPLIEGPNKTKIRILSRREDYELFDSQLRQIVEERRPVLEEVGRKRKEALQKVKDLERRLRDQRGLLFDQSNLFGNTDEVELSAGNLSREEREEFNRLSSWLLEGEKEYTRNHSPSS